MKKHVEATYNVGSKSSIAEPASRISSREVLSIRWEIAFHHGFDVVVVVAGIHNGISENEHRRDGFIEGK